MKNKIKELLDNEKNLIIFDLGCNDGSDTIWFEQNLSINEIHSFELDKRNFEFYLNDIKNNFRESGKIHVNNYAISDKIGTIEANLSTDTYWGHLNTGSNSIKDISNVMYQEFPWIRFDEKINVDTITLDYYCEKNNIKHIDLIWADIQGLEKDMISGAKEILKNTKYMVLEIYPKPIHIDMFTTVDEFLTILPDWECIYKNEVDALFKNKNKKYN